MILQLHHVPGRLRVSLSMLKRNEPAARPLRARLRALAGVRSVSVNPLTGSVIVHYDRDEFDPAALWATLHRLGYIDQAPPCLSFRSCGRAQANASSPAASLAKALAGAVLERWLGRPAGLLISLLI